MFVVSTLDMTTRTTADQLPIRKVIPLDAPRGVSDHITWAAAGFQSEDAEPVDDDTLTEKEEAEVRHLEGCGRER